MKIINCLKRKFIATPAQKDLMLDKYDYYNLINLVLLIVDVGCFVLIALYPNCWIIDLASGFAIGILIYFITSWLPKAIDYILFWKHYKNDIQHLFSDIHEVTLINLKSFNITNCTSYSDVADGIINNYSKLFAPLFYEVQYSSNGGHGPHKVNTLNEYNTAMMKKIISKQKQIKICEGKYSSFLYFASIIRSIEKCKFINFYNDINLIDNYCSNFCDLIEIHKYIHKHYPKFDLKKILIYSSNEYKTRVEELNQLRDVQSKKTKELMKMHHIKPIKDIHINLHIE